MPALDGIRAVAVLLVLLAHFDPTAHYLTGGGTVGVDLFFVLSGFLITSILLAEWSEDADINLRAFYRRRVLRLWPALVLLLAFYAIAAPLISTVPRDHFSAALAAALSYMNWQQAALHGPEGFVGHAWSLSIEEQFYLVWPTLLIIILWFSRKAVTLFLAALLIGTVAWRCYLTFHGASVIRIYAGTDAHADPLLIGCLLAALTLSAIRTDRLAGAWPLPAAALLAIVLTPAWSTRWFLWEFTANGILGAWLVAAVMQKRSGLLAGMLSSSTMVWLGRRSYGVYLWHVPMMKALTFLKLPPWPRALLGIPISLIIAAVSYRFVEEPILRRK